MNPSVPARNGPITPRSSSAPPAAAVPNDELEVLIRARYPIIFVVSWEEARVEQHLQRIAARRGKQLYTWSVTNGMQKASAVAAGGPRQRSLSDPVEALDQVIEHKEPAIYVFRDLHAFLRPSLSCCRPAIRKLREVARALSDSYKTLVICSPLLEMAPELEKDVTVYDYPLPTAKDVEGWG